MLQMWFHVVRQGVETSVTQDTIGAVYIQPRCEEWHGYDVSLEV